MNKIILIAAILLTAGAIKAQNNQHVWGAGINFGTKDYYGDAGSAIIFGDVNINPSLRLARYISPSFDLGLNASFGRYDFSNPDSTVGPYAKIFRTKTWEAQFNVRYKFNNGYILKEHSFIQPYVTVGLGYANFANRITALNTSTVKEGGLNIPVGAGLNFRINDRFAINLQSIYNFNNVDAYDNLSNFRRNNDKYLFTSIGAVYCFGKSIAIDTDKDGVPDERDKCQGTIIGTKVDKNGCPQISETTIFQVREIASKIYFETNSDTLKEISKKELDILVDILQLNSMINIDIQGHADNIGTPANNMELSQKRANTVRQYLIEKGIDPARIVAKGYGETKPVDANSTEIGKAKNRRVELILHY